MAQRQEQVQVKKHAYGDEPDELPVEVNPVSSQIINNAQKLIDDIDREVGRG